MDRTGLPSRTPEVPGVELLELIGSGGSGAVYRGRQAQLGRDVAVKVVSAPGAPEASQARWRREVDAMGRLSNHPNIVGVYDGGTTADGSPYLVMPYVPGGTLKDRLRSGPVPPAEVARLGAKLAGALASAHAAGVLHRDVKPENVLLSPYGEPQLADFGIARMADATTTAAGDLHATIPYAAPEVLDGRSASEASDVYGLGATLHACLTGSAPYVAGPDETMVALVSRVLTQPPPSLHDAGVPGPLADVVGRAMSRDPGQRQVSAAALRRELDVVADQLATAGAGSDGPATTVLAPPAGATTPITPEPPPPPPPPTEVAPTSDPPPAASRQHAVVGAAPVDPPPAWPSTVGDDRPPSRRTPTWLVPLAAVAVVVLLALGAWALLAGDGDDGTATAPTTTAPTTVATTPSTEPPTTAAPTTAPTTAPPTTAAPTTAPAPPPPPAPVSDDLAGAATTYFATLDAGDLDQAWQLTTSRFQNAQDRDEWQRFWGGYDTIEIVGPLRVDERRDVVVVPLALDGAREDYTLELRRQGGAWLVDGPVSRS